MSTYLKENFDKSLDSYLLKSSFALLLTFAYVFQSNPPKNKVEILATIISVSFLFLSFISLLWSKYRWPYRKSIFEMKSKKIIDKYSEKLTDFIVNVVRPFAELAGKEYVAKELSKTKNKQEFLTKLEKLKSKIDRDEGLTQTQKANQLYGDVIESFVTNIQTDLTESYNRCFRKPLKEKSARLKHFADIFSLKTQRYTFSIGAISFLLSIILHLAS